jgi:hypothetical protein
MIDLRKIVIRAAAFSVILVLGAACGVAADDGFRIENKVYLGDEKEPSSRSTTIFQDRAVYDYLDKPGEVVVFEKRAERFVLLDTKRRVRAELPTENVVTFTEQLQRYADAQKDPMLKFFANPVFEEQCDKASGVLTFNSTWLSYRLKTAPAPTAAIAQRYREFCDWYARLGPILDPASRPPFARMRVNAVLEEKGLLPTEVSLTLAPKKGLWPKRISIRSEHELALELGAADVQRVSQTRQFMMLFNPVSITRYIRAVD